MAVGGVNVINGASASQKQHHNVRTGRGFLIIKTQHVLAEEKSRLKLAGTLYHCAHCCCCFSDVMIKSMERERERERPFRDNGQAPAD